MTGRLAAVLLLAAATACGGDIAPSSEPTRFGSPLLGQPMAELFQGAYVDEAGRDYACGVKYYAGHQGTDILLRSFRAQDSGVTVIAAAAGQVVGIHDGEFDRNTSRSPGREWNFVALRHPDGLVSYYGHLRSGSLRVVSGQSVSRGAALAQVGSSGDSNWPHLHFEVRRGSDVLDPWAGDCSQPESLWSSQLPYQNAFQLVDTGMLDRPVGGLDDLLERPPDVEPLTGATGAITFWAELFNVQSALLRAEFFAPDGALLGTVDEPDFRTFSMTFVVVTLPIPAGGPAGRYTVTLRAEPGSGGPFAEIARRSFQVSPPASSPPARLGSTGGGPIIRRLAPGSDGGTPSRP